MRIRHSKMVVLPRAELLCALQHMSETRVCRVLRALCRASILDYFSVAQGDYTFSRGDMAFKPKNAWEERFWHNVRDVQKKYTMRQNVSDEVKVGQSWSKLVNQVKVGQSLSETEIETTVDF